MSSNHRVGLELPDDLVEELHDLLDRLQRCAGDVGATGDPGGVVASLIQAEHRLHAATTQAVGCFDELELASSTPHRSTKRWLEHTTRLSSAQAAHLVRSARALRDHLPETRGALARGEVSPAHVAAVCTVVREVGAQHARRCESILIDLAREVDPSVVRRATAALIAMVDPKSAEDALHRAYERRGVTLSVVGEHAYLRGVLDVQSAEILQAALAPLMAPATGEMRSAPQRRADGLVDLAKRALDAGELPSLGSQRSAVSIVVDADALQTGTGAVTLPWTGVAVPVGSVMGTLCDAHLTPVLARRDGDGTWLPLKVGRASRTVTAGQARALVVRDGGCVYPGCSRTAAFCDAHHVVHWADGGATDLDNLALLCRHHHTTLHRRQWSLTACRDREGRFDADIGTGSCPAQTAADRSPPGAALTRPRRE
jgi:hypothetical protein